MSAHDNKSTIYLWGILVGSRRSWLFTEIPNLGIIFPCQFNLINTAMSVQKIIKQLELFGNGVQLAALR